MNDYDNAKPDQLLIGAADLCYLLGFSQAFITRLELRGDFPKRLKIGRRIAWRKADIDAWLASH